MNSVETISNIFALQYYRLISSKSC